MASTVELRPGGRDSAPAPDPLIGRTLLHYRVVEAIGQGGMSVVYRGQDEHLARDVAIKVLHPFLAEKPECRARLAREARAVARLEHPNIVKVYDSSGEGSTAGDDDDRGAREAPRTRPAAEGFLVAELVRGVTLRRYAERQTLWRCPELGALAVWQLLHALQHAHDQGVVHRDLKPENVMVRDDGVLKLMDFGIAQVADQGGLTITGTLLGSPAHMAPECIDGHPADERSDLFAMGTVLYWITTGSLPFDGPTPHALLKQIVDGRSTPAQQRSPLVSDDLARVIARSMATRPADRFGSAGAFADALAEVLGKSGVDVDDRALTAALAAPGDSLPRLGARVRATFLGRANVAWSEGATARALAALNRVLADDPDNPDARALLDRVHAADEPAGSSEAVGHSAPVAALDSVPDQNTDPATLPPHGSRPPLVASTVSSPAASALSAAAASLAPGPSDIGEQGASVATPPTLLPGPAASLHWQRWVVVAAAVGLVVASVVVARAVDDAAQSAALAAATTDADLPEREPGDATTTEDAQAAAPDPAGAGPTPPATLPSKKPRRLTNTLIPRDIRPSLQAPALSPTKPVPEPTAVVRRRVLFRINAWADIVIDGVVAARNQQVFTTDLTVGPHTVLFQNPRAKDHALKLDVAAGGPDPVITVRLEPRPALLSVRASQPDALVDVGGAGGVPAADTLGRPLLVALEQSRQEREVFIFKPGYLAYRRRHTFLAGETLRLDVVLEPDPGDVPPKTR